MHSAERISFEAILSGLSAAGEATRLRLLALLAEAELTVSELVVILGQSQPRISRHLKLLLEAGLVERHREGAWAFFLIAQTGPLAALARDLVARVAPNDPILSADRSRLAEVRRQRAEQAARYFEAQAINWDELRAMHVPEERVEAAIRETVGTEKIEALLDLGTGTGRMLELLAPLASRAVGVDQSPQMLGLARVRLERAGLRNTQLRQGDLYALPVEPAFYDHVIMHQVLHYLDDPLRALREAGRALRADGRLLIIDFAPHEEESLRTIHAHRRLGFTGEEMAGFMEQAGLECVARRDLAPTPDEGGKLTVSLWLGHHRSARPNDRQGSKTSPAREIA
ncbi:metalloregulator ArsR/SmtB family transcription factor [Beijerinckia indica]|uniref:Transcriptional regulator, ArsR family n=1 Tax=Beijerinckia indica subsp. indica (strain ATCC 9039 / DSM 1715 / NCIMB 8712) TaxID=395963 RepID=B2IJ00_BEII9|nr:metalloregulator ArsR/SmtB family transcription factor [Beijerinckia indica]ACB94763.1 transcriptional regulator, ArsR family [Beijerinckia indica subsp. indica ATCC 9039]